MWLADERTPWVAGDRHRPLRAVAQPTRAKSSVRVLDFTASLLTSCLIGWWRLDFDRPALMTQNEHTCAMEKTTRNRPSGRTPVIAWIGPRGATSRRARAVVHVVLFCGGLCLKMAVCPKRARFAQKVKWWRSGVVGDFRFNIRPRVKPRIPLTPGVDRFDLAVGATGAVRRDYDLSQTWRISLG